MAPTRKSFSAKFKAEVLKYITEKGCSNSAAARHFGVDEKNIRRWKTQSGSLHAVIKNGFPKAKQLPGSGRRPLPLLFDLVPKIHRFILHFRKLMTEKSYHEENIWAFDETAVWF